MPGTPIIVTSDLLFFITPSSFCWVSITRININGSFSTPLFSFKTWGCCVIAFCVFNWAWFHAFNFWVAPTECQQSLNHLTFSTFYSIWFFKCNLGLQQAIQIKTTYYEKTTFKKFKSSDSSSFNIFVNVKPSYCLQLFIWGFIEYCATYLPQPGHV